VTLVLSFTVPGPPVPAARPIVRHAHGERARAITPRRTAAYEQLVGIHTMQAMRKVRWVPGERGPFGVAFEFYRAKDVGDWDNYSKAACDGISLAHAWSNDARVHFGVGRLLIDRERPRTEIRVWHLEDGPEDPLQVRLDAAIETLHWTASLAVMNDSGYLRCAECKSVGHYPNEEHTPECLVARARSMVTRERERRSSR
jgi:Holliday junction resolvase RusA-like endonuclease